MDNSSEKVLLICPICNRLVPDNSVEKHHLVPKSKKGKVTVDLCRSCGDAIHQFISISELNKQYNTVEKIKSHPKIENWIKWISKKPNDFSVCMKSKKRKK